MQLDVASYSNIGGREVNEDTTLSKQSEDFLLAAVADGLGGHGGGKTASTRAIQSLEEQEPLIRIMNEESLSEACALANRAVLDAQTPQVRMKTTLALAAVSNSAIAFLHVGDSRAYLFRAGEIEYQSQDHSVSQLAVLMGSIRPEQIRFHEDRNKVLRSLGTEAGATPEIHVEDEPLREGDAILLCTDGFWEYVTEREMLRALHRARNAEDWMARMVVLIKRRAGKKNDNNSAVVVLCPKAKRTTGWRI